MDEEQGNLEEHGNSSEKTKRIIRSDISPNAMDSGRDEMNLVEFPLAGLSDRVPTGRNSLVFEDTIWDRSRGENVRRRLTIAGSAEYGLPVALDDEVMLGLIQVSKASRFESRCVAFRPAELIRLLGWRPEGRSYDRLEKSLRKWLAVTLYYDNAWWDKQRKAWVDEHFHLIDHVVIRRRLRRGGTTAGHGGQAVAWSFAWNEVVFRSFQVGYLKQLDMKMYRSLKSPAAKRLYRFLDKRFHFSNDLAFDLKMFACEHIGFSRAYDNSQLKRRLKPAVAELEDEGYLQPLPPQERFLKVCHGKWKIRLIRRQTPRRRTKRTSHWHKLERELVERGVAPTSAARLVREYPHDMIRQKMIAFDHLAEGKGSFELRNPGGFLAQSIRDGDTAGVSENIKSKSLDCEYNRSGPTSEAVARAQQDAEENRRQQEERQVIEEYLGKLSPEDLEMLAADALRRAKPILVEGYERSKRGDNLRLSEEYRTMILYTHVRDIMGLNP
jgi:hypothetical protein